jgi:hypothetical protein
MTRLSKKFTTLGLRADRNLADVNNPELALNGLLNDLVNDSDPEKSFDGRDLAPIQGIQNTSINAAKLSVLSGITISATAPGISLLPTEVVPLVRIVDRLEKIKTVTGDIPAIQGGDGLIATFIPSSSVNPGSTASTGSTIFTIPTDPITELLWDSGYFNFPSFIDPSFVDSYGGIQWEGYFVPSLRDSNVVISISSTGLIMFEIDRNDNGSWETLVNVYSDERTIPFTSNSEGNTVYNVGAQNVKFASVGDFIKNTTTTVTAISADSITLSDPYTAPGGSIILKKASGQTITSNSVSLPSLEIGKQLKIRLSYWFPDDGNEAREKYLQLGYQSSNLSFSNLYSVKPSEVFGANEIRQVLQDAISPFQTEFGASSANKNFFINNTSLINYQPTVFSLAAIRKAGPGELTFTAGSNLVSGSVLANSTIGNIIIPADPNSSVNDAILVKEKFSSSVGVVNLNPSINETISVNIIENKGLVGWYKTTSLGNTVSLVTGSTSKLKSGFVVITNTSSLYIRITEIVNLTTFTTTVPINLTGNEIIYIYSDRSLVDKSKDVFCKDVFGKVVSVTAPVGAQSLQLTNVVGVALGQYVQFEGSISPSTTVSGLPGSNIIELSSPLIKELPGSNTVAFVPNAAGGTINREGCIIPLNTAPPFVGTDIGLSTNNKNIKSSSTISNFSVEAERVGGQVNSSNVSKPSLADLSFDKKVFIKSKLNNQIRNFSILSVKKP